MLNFLKNSQEEGIKESGRCENEITLISSSDILNPACPCNHPGNYPTDSDMFGENLL